MDDTLLNPNQPRAFGSTVQGIPYGGDPMYISIPDGDELYKNDRDERILLPLRKFGLYLCVVER